MKLIKSISIPKKLFEGIYDYAGILRNYNITKKEWKLNGETVVYGTATELMAYCGIKACVYEYSQKSQYNYFPSS